MPIAKIHRISATSPDDTGGIEAAIAAGRLDPKGIVAILGKTEGNGCVNDFSRGFATQSLLMMLQKFLPDNEARKVCLVMSGGTEGGMAPHWTVFERGDGNAPPQGAALAVGRAHTPPLPFEHLGRLAPNIVGAVGGAAIRARHDRGDTLRRQLRARATGEQ